MTDDPITEEDLHCFIDGKLDPHREAKVAVHLEQYPDVAERIFGYAELGKELRSALSPIVDEPLPTRLDLAQIISQQGARRDLSWQFLPFAAALLLCVGGAFGWTLRELQTPPIEGVTLVAQEAAEAYAVFAEDPTRPVEMHADERAELASWATSRLGHSVAIPNLVSTGYRFMGGRIITTAHGPAAMFMYDNDGGARLVILTRPMRDRSRTTPMSSHNNGTVNGFAWAEQGLGYSIIGQDALDVLHPIAAEVRRQVSNRI